MSCHAGPDIVENGLVFCYDMNNTQKSWRGKPTTNLSVNDSFYSNWTNSGTGVWNADDTSIQRLYSQYPVLSLLVTTTGNLHISCGRASISNALTYTVSVYFYIPYSAGILAGSAPYIRTDPANTSRGTLSYNGDANWNNWPRDKWIRVTQTFTNTANDTALYISCYLNDLNNKIYMTAPTVENINFMTPFVGGAGSTRSNTQAILDLTNNNIITASNLTYNSDGSFSLDGTDDYFMTGPINGIGSSTTSFSMSVWVYPSSTAGNIISMSSTNPSGSWNMPPIAATGQQFFGKIWSNNRLYSSTYSLNTWYNLVLVFNYTTSGQYFYVNGNLTDSQTGITYGASGASNYLFFGQQNPGTDNCGMFSGKIGDIKIYTNKALSAAEIAQNFNATRRIYGI